MLVERWMRIMQTIQFPWIIAVHKYCGDDVRAARDVGGFATEKMDNKIFIWREEVETWR
jgi:hypothetical protein